MALQGDAFRGAIKVQVGLPVAPFCRAFEQRAAQAVGDGQVGVVVEKTVEFLAAGAVQAVLEILILQIGIEGVVRQAGQQFAEACRLVLRQGLFGLQVQGALRGALVGPVVEHPRQHVGAGPCALARCE